MDSFISESEEPRDTVHICKQKSLPSEKKQIVVSWRIGVGRGDLPSESGTDTTVDTHNLLPKGSIYLAKTQGYESDQALSGKKGR